MTTAKRISDFRLLTFDTYGTLIDWETGIWNALAPIRARLSTEPDREAALEAFARHEAAAEEETPDRLYRHLLADAHVRMTEEWGLDPLPGEAERFGASVPDWPAFSDAPEGLAWLRRHFFIATLTNCDRQSYRGSNERLGDPWHAIWTAEDVGAYKPSKRNFDFLVRTARTQFGVEPEDILHVAQSLYHDIVPAARYGLPHTAWIDRRHLADGSGATPRTDVKVDPDWRFTSLAELVEAHRVETEAE